MYQKSAFSSDQKKNTETNRRSSFARNGNEKASEQAREKNRSQSKIDFDIIEIQN